MIRKMNQLLRTLIILISIFLISSCGGGGSSDGSSNSSVTLSWTAPTLKNDGSVLAVNELASYRIYYGTRQTSLNDYIEIDATQHMSSYNINTTINFLGNTRYFLAMTVVDNQGRESSFSDIINFNSQ